MTTLLARANLLALLLPGALLGGALGSQYLGGLYPCEMCHWQRWPHYAAVAFALIAFLPKQPSLRRALILLAAVAIMVSGAIGVFHAGVEYGWWKGPSQCSAGLSGASDTMAAIWTTPLVTCDQPQWTLLGVSLAGFNAIISLIGGGLILWITRKTRRRF